MQSTSSYIAMIILQVCLTTAWQIPQGNRIHRSCQLLVNICSLHKSSSLFLSTAASGESNDRQECGASTNPLTTKLASEDSSHSAARKTLNRKPKPGDIVTFTLLRFQPVFHKDKASHDDDIDFLFDTNGTLQMILRDGQHLPELHSLLSTMSPGETVRHALIDGGYGPHRPELQFALPIAQMGKSIDVSSVNVGTQLRFDDTTSCRVVSVSEEEWICDANHALAGTSYHVDVTLERVEAGIQEWGFINNENSGVNGRYRIGTFALGCFWGGGN